MAGDKVLHRGGERVAVQIDRKKAAAAAARCIAIWVPGSTGCAAVEQHQGAISCAALALVRVRPMSDIASTR